MQLESDFKYINEQLTNWQSRRQTAAFLLWIPRGLLAGLLLGVVIAAVARFRPLLTNAEVGFVALGLAAVGLILGFVFVLLRRRPLLSEAQLADQQFGLQERVSTALEIHAGELETEPQLAHQQLSDTIRAMQQVDVVKALPLEINTQDWLMILLAIVLLAVAVYFPNPQVAILNGQRAVQQEIAEQIEALEALQEEILQNEALTPEQQNQLLEPIQDALQQLEEGDLTQEEGVAVLSEAEAELRDLAQSNNNDALRQQLEAAGQSLSNNLNGQQLGESLQNGQLSRAGAEAAQLAQELSSLTAEEQAQLAQDLAETAAALQGTDDELAQQFAEAAEALQNGDVAAAQQALQEAAGTLQERAQQQAASQQANQAANQVSQGRQEMAQAGQPSQQGQQGQAGQQGQQGQGQQGQGQQGQGQQGGEGQGQGQQGQQGGEGQGQGQQGQQGQEGGESEGTGGVGQGGGHTENVFVPEFVDLSGEAGVEVELPAECIANPDACGSLLNETPTDFTEESSLIPYSQVYSAYRDAAYEALNDDYVPLGLKGYVRDYFSSLEPNTQE